VAGLAAAIVAVTAVVGTLRSHDPADDVSTVDASSSTSSTSSAPAPTDGSAPASTAPDTRPPATPPPTTAAPTGTTPPTGSGADDARLVPLVDGVVATSTTTSSWDRGYCIEIRVENTTTAPVEWKVRSALDGTIATLWSAVADDQGGGIVVFTGEEGYNRQLAAGASTTFGTCVDTP
jgi:cellulase/cellobiase CelA1